MAEPLSCKVKREWDPHLLLHCLMSEEACRILLAEDDLNLGVLLVDYLETAGFHVKLCKDGELALQAFHNNVFDLCLLDVMMPKLDGFSVAKEIRSVNKEIPVL